MTGPGSPCGACKFLRRKCVWGCVFAPYFCHEHGATHFAAIHKVFGASNASKLLAHLPVNHRCEAAFTISYEAQARLQDPIYGCVSHIFALQQQVVNLEARVAILKEQKSRRLLNGPIISNSNPSERSTRTFASNYPENIQSWFECDTSNMIQTFDPNLAGGSYGNTLMNPDLRVNVENPREMVSVSSVEEAAHFLDAHEIQTYSRQWSTQGQADELLGAFGYIQH